MFSCHCADNTRLSLVIAMIRVMLIALMIREFIGLRIVSHQSLMSAGQNVQLIVSEIYETTANHPQESDQSNYIHILKVADFFENEICMYIQGV